MEGRGPEWNGEEWNGFRGLEWRGEERTGMERSGEDWSQRVSQYEQQITGELKHYGRYQNQS